MDTTKIMATKKNASESTKQPKAVVIRTSEEAIELLDELMNGVDRKEWLNATKNGALKLSTSKPELKEDNKGTLKVGNTTYYLVSAGTTKTAILISFRSYLVYKLRVKAVAERLANFPTFEEWCNKQNQWKQLESVGVVITDEQKLAAYNAAKAKLGESEDIESEE